MAKYWIPKTRKRGRWVSERRWIEWVYLNGWRDGLVGKGRELLLGDRLNAAPIYAAGLKAGLAAASKLNVEGRKRAREYASTGRKEP